MKGGTMKVRCLSGRGGLRIGEVMEFSERQARHLVAEGLASYIEPQHVQRVDPEPVVEHYTPTEYVSDDDVTDWPFES